jgi:hypothetical protein
MSAVPRDDRNRPAVTPSVAEPAWQTRQGLTLSEAEDLLDQLEACGVAQREMRIEADGVTVRWRPTWPRLLAE